jgi:hypothetical protein
MSKRNFDWDNYLSQATYRDVVNLSPVLSRDRPPTMYSPDRTLLYLSSLDLDVDTDNVPQLEQFLVTVLDTYRNSQQPGFEKKRLAVITDCYEICGLLVNCGVDSEAYLNPDSLLTSAILRR